MKTNLVTISNDAAVFEAARKMKQEGIGSLLVENAQGKPSAIVTQGDIVCKCVAAQKMGCTVGEVASKPLITIEGEEDLAVAAKKMGQERVKRLVVTKNGKAVGIISQSDIIGISPSLYDLIAAKAGN